MDPGYRFRGSPERVPRARSYPVARAPRRGSAFAAAPSGIPGAFGRARWGSGQAYRVARAASGALGGRVGRDAGNSGTVTIGPRPIDSARANAPATSLTAPQARRLGQIGGPGRGWAGEQPRLELPDELRAVVDAVGVRHEPLVDGELRCPEYVAQRLELAVVADGDDDFAVGGARTTRTARCSGGGCPSGRGRRPRREAGRLVDERGQQRREQGDLDALAQAAALALAQRREDPDRREQAGDHVDERDADLLRAPSAAPVMLISPPIAWISRS